MPGGLRYHGMSPNVSVWVEHGDVGQLARTAIHTNEEDQPNGWSFFFRINDFVLLLTQNALYGVRAAKHASAIDGRVCDKGRGSTLHGTYDFEKAMGVTLCGLALRGR